MKKLIYILSALLVISSCGDTEASIEDLIAQGDVEAIRARKDEVSERQKAIQTDIQKLDSAIARMDSNEKLPLVTAVKAAASKFEHYLELQGGVKTKQNVLVYPEMSGTLQRIYVKEGDKVRKGQLLALIDDGGMGSQLEQLKTRAQLAETTFERRKRLWEQKIGSEIEYLSAKTEFEAAQNTVKQAESQLGKSTIRAPFTGIIDNVIKDQGTVVSPGPGSEVFRIVNLSDMYIEVDVPENYLSGVKPGKEAKVYFPVIGDTITTKVRQTGNFIDPGNRAFSVEIPVPNKDGNIKPNLTARVQINDYTSEEAIVIPQSIISENAEGQQFVYVAQPVEGENLARVEKSIIETGKVQGSQVEILSGISDGDQIIKEGARSVKDGQKVKILQQSVVENE